MTQTLFRSEAGQHQQQRLLGEVTLAQPLPLQLWIAFGVVLLISLLGFLLSAEVHRKERVSGRLQPSKGVLLSRAQQSGTITEIYVQEGSAVHEGQALFALANRRGSNTALGPLVLEVLNTRQALIAEAIANNERLLAEELATANARRTELLEQARLTERQMGLLEARIELQQHWFEKRSRLALEGHVAQVEVSQSKERLLSLEQSREELQQQLRTINQEAQQVRALVRQLPLQYAETIRNYQQQAAQLTQQQEEARASFNTVIRAAQPGRVTSVRVKPGQEVVTGEPLLNMIPVGSVLLAELELPSKSAGLVKTGQKLRLRFDAFPYQRYGQIDAEIIQFDKTLVNANAVSQSQGLPPVYRLRAHLAAQNLTYGEQLLPLRSGMQVEADILLEQRRLLDWLLQPLIGFKARQGAS